MQNHVSFGLIVRNEEYDLPTCLQSIAGIADEIIVVDTGSTDRTKEVAAGFKAKVFDFPWVDDFAAARNESIRHATGEWVFWMDADERVDASNYRKIKALFDNLPSSEGEKGRRGEGERGRPGDRETRSPTHHSRLTTHQTTTQHSPTWPIKYWDIPPAWALDRAEDHTTVLIKFDNGEMFYIDADYAVRGTHIYSQKCLKSVRPNWTPQPSSTPPVK